MTSAQPAEAAGQNPVRCSELHEQRDMNAAPVQASRLAQQPAQQAQHVKPAQIAQQAQHDKPAQIAQQAQHGKPAQVAQQTQHDMSAQVAQQAQQAQQDDDFDFRSARQAQQATEVHRASPAMLAQQAQHDKVGTPVTQTLHDKGAEHAKQAQHAQRAQQAALSPYQQAGHQPAASPPKVRRIEADAQQRTALAHLLIGQELTAKPLVLEAQQHKVVRKQQAIEQLPKPGPQQPPVVLNASVSLRSGPQPSAPGESLKRQAPADADEPNKRHKVMTKSLETCKVVKVC